MKDLESGPSSLCVSMCALIYIVIVSVACSTGTCYKSTGKRPPAEHYRTPQSAAAPERTDKWPTRRGKDFYAARWDGRRPRWEGQSWGRSTGSGKGTCKKWEGARIYTESLTQLVPNSPHGSWVDKSKWNRPLFSYSCKDKHPSHETIINPSSSGLI